jgi:hypothetical protein
MAATVARTLASSPGRNPTPITSGSEVVGAATMAPVGW